MVIGVWEGGRRDREFEINMCTFLYLKWITNKGQWSYMDVTVGL